MTNVTQQQLRKLKMSVFKLVKVSSSSEGLYNCQCVLLQQSTITIYLTTIFTDTKTEKKFTIVCLTEFESVTNTMTHEF